MTSKLIISGMDKSVVIWNRKDQSTRIIRDTHTAKIKKIKATDNEKYLITSSEDSTIKVFDIRHANIIEHHKFEFKSASGNFVGLKSN